LVTEDHTEVAGDEVPHDIAEAGSHLRSTRLEEHVRVEESDLQRLRVDLGSPALEILLKLGLEVLVQAYLRVAVSHGDFLDAIALDPHEMHHGNGDKKEDDHEAGHEVGHTHPV